MGRGKKVRIIAHFFWQPSSGLSRLPKSLIQATTNIGNSHVAVDALRGDYCVAAGELLELKGRAGKPFSQPSRKFH